MAIIIIIHGLSAVRMADCIYFLKDGRIEESRTHDELISLGDMPSYLVIQASYYREMFLSLYLNFWIVGVHYSMHIK